MADCIWKIVYQHTADGSRTSGNLNDLVKAVKAGADVQVRYYRSSAISGIDYIEWHRACAAVTLAEADVTGLPIVSCAITDIPDTDFGQGSGRTFNQPYAFEWQVYNTTGRRHTVKFTRTSLDVASDVTDSLGVTWYVRGYKKPTWWDQLIARVSLFRIGE